MPAEKATSVASTDVLSVEVRRQVVSGTRMKIAFTVVTLLMLSGLSTVMVLSVDHIFNWLNPAAHKDLAWKTQRGVVELARTTDLGILLRDRALIAESARDYEADAEVRLFAVLDAHGDLLYQHKKGDVQLGSLFSGAPHELRESALLFSSWSDVKVEGERVGRLGLAVSTERLRAGERLRGQILRAALGACLLAVMLSLAFVQLYVGPLIAVTKRAFLALEQKTFEALESTRVKGEFVANMSHEIRTPLNAVLGMLGLLLRGTLSPAQRRRAEIGESSARSLLALVSDVLDFSKMEAGQHVLYPTDCDLRVLVQNRTELLAVKAHAKQLDIAYRFSADVPALVRLDAERLVQILTNLMGNAIKFSEEGEVLVEVRVEACADTEEGEVQLRFEVRDTGPGIAPSEHGRLFKSFSQVDGSATRVHEGTGLGLSISKHLVELMKGEIGVTSELGQGASFWFSIRCPVIQPAEASSQRSGSLKGRRILIAYPHRSYRELLCEYARDWGMAVSATESADEALKMAKEASQTGRAFEFALLDLGLEDASGESLARGLAQVSGTNLSLIQLTPALWTPPDNQNGATQSFLAKPVRASELYACIANGAPDAEGSPLRTQRAGQRRGHILVVDDNEVNRVLAEELLHELGHTCEQAAGGREALDQVSARVYDAILMDCQMPGMNGYQATYEIRELERRSKRRTPIIALTAHAFSSEVQKVKEAGMDDFLTKPVTPEVLDAALQKWMAKASTGRMRSLPSLELGKNAQQRISVTGGIEPQRAEPDPAQGHAVLEDRPRSLRLLEIFLRLVPEQVVALVQASGGGDFESLRERAHKLKGSALSIGALRMAKLCEAMQEAAEARDGSYLTAWATGVAAELDALRPRLEGELSQKRTQGTTGRV